ncbi:(d)CMP kinase [Halalkalibacterium halodurans]|uniref:(d)CMP kinase n=1 Tax=Halalkalibacterium halodurans TaxID=86665 RepID=UPI001068070B|nr:(d)CMP kinase [Halalkalibacterium halodurans]MED3646728.1 (d)CMP kinase [Halalkalibacterium halodurans]TES57714.1 (d)CMP kinase [Halalkalibacterium halodurans]
MKKMKIAIDGPAGAGKSTVAKQVAQALSFLYIDTGAMYRALTYAAIKHHVSPDDEASLKSLLDSIEIKLVDEQAKTRVYVNNTDVTDQVRTDEVTKSVSLVSSHGQVRKEMVRQQRLLAEDTNCVLDGRDIGTYVLPNAELKFFLTATVEERARRRYEENIQKGFKQSLEQLIKDIARRDEFDSNRSFAPLRKAEDAIEIDTTSLSISEVTQTIIGYVKERV